MSFDLYFCEPPGAQIDNSRLHEHVKGLEHVTESRSNDGRLIQFEYSNPATGVYCLFDLHTALGNEPEEALVIPDEYRNSGLSVSINFLRPHFFALESMPIVSGVADSLDLSLYDPQEGRVYAPETPSEVLIESWMKHNEWATQATAKHDEPILPYLPREQSLYWWRYARAREMYQKSLGKDLFVPSILLMVDADKRVKLTVVWSAEVRRRLLLPKCLPLPQVFPLCDHLMLVWGKPEPEGLRKAVVPYSVAMVALASLLEDIDGPVAALKVLRPHRQSEASKIFDRLRKDQLGNQKQIPPDGFVDFSLT
jgi:hypothetical protein